MILRRRSVELLTGEHVPTTVRGLVDSVIVLGGLPCSVIATRAHAPIAMAVGWDRRRSLGRLAQRLAGPPSGAARRSARPRSA